MVSYTWDLGDGSFSIGETIIHTYAETGVYTPVVTATNAINTMTDTTTVVIVDETITGLNVVNDSPTTLSETTTLTATIDTGSNVSYNWDFGDFSDLVSGSDEVVAHIYSNPGVYTATVTASNSVSESEVPATTTVSIISPEKYIYLPLIVKSSP
jgi:PKD repeat protein